MVSELAAVGVLTVPITSKTTSEVLALVGSLEFAAIAAVEGGSVVIRSNGATEVIGLDRSRLVIILRELSGRAGRSGDSRT